MIFGVIDGARAGLNADCEAEAAKSSALDGVQSALKISGQWIFHFFWARFQSQQLEQLEARRAELEAELDELSKNA